MQCGLQCGSLSCCCLLQRVRLSAPHCLRCGVCLIKLIAMAHHVSCCATNYHVPTAVVVQCRCPVENEQQAAVATVPVPYESITYSTFFSVCGLYLATHMPLQCGQCIGWACSQSVCSCWQILCVLVLLNAMLYAGSWLQWMLALRTEVQADTKANLVVVGKGKGSYIAHVIKVGCGAAVVRKE